jgi:hypothetical protein
MSTGYKELDDKICGHLATRPDVHPIYSNLLAMAAAKELGRDIVFGDDKEWRLIDRRLQALKKAGRIRYERPRWVLVLPNVRANLDPTA